MEKKKILTKDLNAYLRAKLEKEYEHKLSEKKMAQILSVMEDSIKELTIEGYSFKLAGINFTAVEYAPKVFKNIKTGEIQRSKAYKGTKITLNSGLKRELREKTEFDSDATPVCVGISKADASI